MSWNLVDGIGSFYGDWANAWKEVTSLGGLARNDVSKFFESEQKKNDLRGAEIVSVLSGVPLVGDFVRGIQGVAQMEDLYDKTGRTSEYGTSSGGSASGIGQGLSKLSGKIEDGTHDLFEHYSGTPDDTEKVNQSRMWSYMTQNWNHRHNNYYMRW